MLDEHGGMIEILTDQEIANAAWQRKHTQQSKWQWITTISCLLLIGVLLPVSYNTHASSIKELQSHIKELQNQNYALESRIKALEDHT